MGETIGRQVGRLSLRGLPLALAMLMALLTSAETSAARGWTGPDLVGPAGYCSSVAAAIDPNGRSHVVAVCLGRLRYSTSAASRAWSTTTFTDPGKTFNLSPQIAIDGGRVYLASSRLAPTPDTCGGPGLHLGVYYRSRNLAGGAWSAPVRLGQPGDDIQSFRVAGGRIHATVTTGSELIYEKNSTGRLRRYQLVDGAGLSSLRVGSDGRARVVYEATHGLRYGVFNGSGVTTSAIPGTTPADGFPVLVLDASNAAHVLWSHQDFGCGNTPGHVDGTYYATNRGGAWTAPGARRFSGWIGPTALTLDVATGRVHALVGGQQGLRYFTRTAGGAWVGLTLTSAATESVSLKLDPSTGRLLAVYARVANYGPGSASLFAFTRP